MTDRRGKFEAADGGTIFLDEIGDMSLKTQAKVLRVLQDQVVEPVGSTQRVRVDVRVIAATNKDLPAAIKVGQFREDLYFRLNVIPIFVPPLRARQTDVPRLAEYFMLGFAQEYGRRAKVFDAEALSMLRRYSWPGNVREPEPDRTWRSWYRRRHQRVGSVVPRSRAGAGGRLLGDGSGPFSCTGAGPLRARIILRALASRTATCRGRTSWAWAKQPVSEDAGVRYRAGQARAGRAIGRGTGNRNRNRE